MPTEYAHVGEYIRQYRRFYNLDQTDLAKAANVSRNTISKAENGKQNLQLDNLVPVLNYLRKKGAPKFDLYSLSK